jgi:hypothetical protein
MAKIKPRQSFDTVPLVNLHLERMFPVKKMMGISFFRSGHHHETAQIVLILNNHHHIG